MRNLKHIILAACLALSGAGHALAEVSDMTVSYCAGQLPEKGDISFSQSDAWVSGAIYVTPGMLSTYSGNQFVAVNAGLASKLNIDVLQVWLRYELDGENIAEGSVSTADGGKIAKGWNKIDLGQAWTIPAAPDKGVYIGYSFHQKGSAFGMAALAAPSVGGFFARFGDGEWEDRSDQGTICIEGLIRGEKLPQINLSLTHSECDPTYIIDHGTLALRGTLKNMASMTVSGFDVSAEIGGERRATAHVDRTLAYNESTDFEVILPLGITEIGDGTGTVKMVIDNIPEGADEDMTDNEATLSFGIVQRDFTRRIFVEEFTSEKCVNCPRVANFMHVALEKEKYADRVLAVCHHSGYYADWLTTSFDNAYTILYNGSTYAPGMAVDRMVVKEGSAVWCPSSQSDMEQMWDKALARPAFVSVNITAAESTEEADKVIVTVEGSKSKDALCDNPTITVFLVENDIPARSQAGSEGSYMHQHVGRAVNSTWGVPLEFNGDDYSYECTMTVQSTWKRENMQAVVVIANRNEADALDNEVENTATLPYSEFAKSGVAAVGADEAEPELFTLSGVKVTATNPAPGIYICRRGAQVSKIMVR